MNTATLPGVSASHMRGADTARAIPDHGTRARYGHRSLACRCNACTAANTRYQQRYRQVVRAKWEPRPWEQLTL